MSALREVIAKFGIQVDDAPLQKLNGGIEDAVGMLKKMAGALGAGLALGALKNFAMGLAEEADELNKQSRTLGLSVQALQEWRYAADLSGVSAEDLASTMARLSGGKFDPKAMTKLGVATTDAGGAARDTGMVLEDVADALSKIQNPAERNRLAMGVLGKSYAKMLPLLEGGKDGLGELRKEFAELGGGFSGSFAKQSEDFNDNLTRMKVLWKGVAITLLSAVMPVLLTLSKRFLTLAKPLVATLKHTATLKTLAAAAGIKGLLVLSKAIGPLGQGLKMLLSRFGPLILAFLFLQDFFTFLEGGDSLIGRALENLFGTGTAERVRQWVFAVKREFLGFLDDLKNRPQKLLDDWEVFTTQLKKDVKGLFGDTFGEMLNVAGGMFVTFIDLLTGGWENFEAKTTAIWDGIKLAFGIVWTELQFGFLSVVATVGDAFTSMWNAVLEGASSTVKALRAVLAAAPGTKSMVEGLDRAISSIQSAKGDASMSAAVSSARDAERLQIARQGDAIGSRIAGSTPTVSGGNVTVTVPPGTGADLAQRVGQAAQRGTTQSLRAAKAALVPGQG